MAHTETLILTQLTLSGFKSLFTKQQLKIAPLTLLSGANSSGKSSVTQALLLLKQTIEAPYDPGTLLLNGPNVRITSAVQLLAKGATIARTSFSIGLHFLDGYGYESTFRRSSAAYGGFELSNTKIKLGEKTFNLSPKSTTEEIKEVYAASGEQWSPFEFFQDTNTSIGAKLTRNRCAFEVNVSHQAEIADAKRTFSFQAPLPKAARIQKLLQSVIHVPGLRGNPERMYATTAVGETFPGRFENYVASIIRSWQESKSDKFFILNSQLQALGLTASLTTQRRSDTEVEIRVSRQKQIANTEGKPNSRLYSLVSIADVGFGVSQILPVLVAMLVAEKNQIVIIEQPELHLHPSAQTKLAEIFASAIKRGVYVIVETHSSLLLLGMQTAVAKQSLKTSQVALNWFGTNDSGHTRVSIGEIDKLGSIGNWPTDFMDVRLDAESAYLDAVEKQLQL